MTDTAPEPAVEVSSEVTAELSRKNMRWGWALFGLFLLLFGGTVGVALVYLWLS